MDDFTTDLRTLLFGETDIFAGFDPDMPLDVQGWGETSAAFDEVFDGIAPKAILEIGTWKGASAVRMAGMAPDAAIVCVDTWLGEIGFIGANDGFGGFLNRRHGHPRIYQQFISNLHHLGLQDRITPVAQVAALACKWLARNGFKFDVIYIDGSHEYEDVKTDIANALQLVAPGGRIFGDDYDWESVSRAVKEHPHHRSHDKWILDL